MLSLSFSESTGSISPLRVRPSGVVSEFIATCRFSDAKSHSRLSLSFSESTGSISPLRVRVGGVDPKLIEKRAYDVVEGLGPIPRIAL